MLILAAAMSAAQVTQTKFTIQGTWQSGNDGDTVFLVKQNQRQMVPVASAVIMDHRFTLEGNTDRLDVVSVFGSQNQMLTSSAQPVFVTGGARISIDMPDNAAGNARIYGEPNNEAWQKLMAEERSFMEKNKAIYNAVSDTTLDIVTRFNARQKTDSLSNVFMSVYVRHIIDNMPLPICGLMLSEYHNSFTDSQMELILSAMEKKMPNDPYYKAIKEHQEILNETAVGKQYKEIALVDNKGSMHRLSEVVRGNKLTLVDFWASWCRPCLAELPNVKKVYDAYHDKGLEIYGVSLDENQLQWQAAIERFRMNWIHVSDLRGWQSAGAKAYGIQGIPATLLIDQSGKIVAKNLRGKDLADMVEKLLK